MQTNGFRFLPVVFVALVLPAIIVSVARADTLICTEILHVVEQSATLFSELCGERSESDSQCQSAYSSPGVSMCARYEDMEKTIYRCTWAYGLQEQQASAVFDQFVDTMRHCVGHNATEQIDEPVNHPDSFLSHIFVLPEMKLTVSLKHKTRLASTLVTVSASRFNPRD